MRPILPLALLAVVALAFAPGAHAARKVVTDPNLPRELPADGPVSVRWTDPAEFTELRHNQNRREAERGTWVADIARHVRRRATELLPEGQKMEVVITDIERAGMFEPWGGARLDHVRIMRDQYSPQMSLVMRITGADGQVILEGERILTDVNYLRGPQPPGGDELRYEKRMIDNWLRREFHDLAQATATAQQQAH